MVSLYIHLCVNTWNGRHEVFCVVVVCFSRRGVFRVCFKCRCFLEAGHVQKTQCTSTQAGIPNKSYLEVLLGRTSLTISGNLQVSCHTSVGPDFECFFFGGGQVMWHQAAKRTPIQLKDQCTRHDQRAPACPAMERAWNDPLVEGLGCTQIQVTKWLSKSVSQPQTGEVQRYYTLVI